MAVILRSKNFYLLASLVTFFIISPLIVGNHAVDLLLTVALAIIILICVNLVSRHHYTRIITIMFGLLAISGYLTIIFISDLRLVFFIHFGVNSIFMTIVTCLVIQAVASEKTITIDTLLGAVCGYLLIGLSWSYYYLTISSFDENAFTYHMIQGPFRDRIQHFIYYSFETLTTLGYGDILPLSGFARAVSWLEAATGQIFLAVWISQLVGLHIAQRIKQVYEKKELGALKAASCNDAQSDMVGVD